MYAFDYHRPQSVAEAANLLASSGDAKLLAGGHTLLPTMKLRLAAPKAIVDLSRIAELKGIDKKGNALVIGAMTTHAEVATSPAVRSAIAGLAELAAGVGDPHVRNRGTIGGSIANNDPAADYPAAVLALGATIATNKREIKADDFFKGLFSTALADGEIITRISFPIPAKFGYAKFANPASRYALAGVAVALIAKEVRVAVTGAGSSGVFRVPAMEAALAKSWAAQSLAGLAVPAADMMSDIHADAAYRAHLVGVMARRAVAKAG
ncbi:MAG: xanthine dehydrogenase family protein subunit M [Hyphomicrobiaceae bacterium]|nr:MAG: xanthine dehydrogenase family protein subunit M [Hyphomicrobiaceae bacterium]